MGATTFMSAKVCLYAHLNINVGSVVFGLEIDEDEAILHNKLL